MALASLTRPLVLASQTRAFLPLWARSTLAYTPSRLASTTADTDSAANSEKDSQPKTYRGPEGELLTRLPLINGKAPQSIEDIDEALVFGSYVAGRSVLPPLRLSKTHGIPAAILHLRSHHVQLLDRFAAVSLHAAGALGISCNNIAHLPTQRTLWTVPKSPFVHKGAQENFERRVHKRAIKVFDADPEVVERWVRFLHQHSEGGVGMRVVRWDRAPVGVGRTALKNVNEALDTKKLTKGKIQQLGEKIVEQESAVVAGQGASDAKAKEVVIPAKEAEPKAAKS